MSRAPALRRRELDDLRFHLVRGTVLQEQVFGQRTGRYGSVCMREMWIREDGGAEWRITANAHCAAVRAGHRVEALVVLRNGCVFLLRIRNGDTGDDRILLTTVRRVGGEAGPTAAMVALLFIPLVLVAVGAVEALQSATGWNLYADAVGGLALAVPLLAGLATAALLSPGMRRRREMLMRRAESFGALPGDRPA